MNRAAAEVLLARRAATRQLAATGALPGEADAVVAEHIHRAVTRPDIRPHVEATMIADTCTEAVADTHRRLQPLFDHLVEQVGNSLARLRAAAEQLYAHLPDEQSRAGTYPGGHPHTPDDRRWAAVIEHRRRGTGAGPNQRQGR